MSELVTVMKIILKIDHDGQNDFKIDFSDGISTHI